MTSRRFAVVAALASGAVLLAAARLAASPPAGGALDRVTTRSGDVLLGRVLGVTADGLLRLADPLFDGEVRVRADALATVTLACREAPSQPTAVIHVANGDRIAGTLTAITPDSVAIQSDAAGPLAAARAAVASIRFSNPAPGALLNSDFARGRLGSWTPDGPAWRLADGSLAHHETGGFDAVWAPLEQAGPVGIEVRFEPQPGSPVVFSLYLFRGPDHSVYLELKAGQFNLGYQNQGVWRNVVTVPVRVPTERMESLRLAYDPASRKLRAWCNGEQIGQADLPAAAPHTGGRVGIGAAGPCRVRSITVTRDAPSAAPAEPPPPADADAVHLANGDRVSPLDIAFADGACRLRLQIGQANCAVEQLALIQFGARNQRAPKARPGDVVVEAGASTLTLRLGSMDEQVLVGVSAYLGEVTIPRGAIRSICFTARPGGAP